MFLLKVYVSFIYTSAGVLRVSPGNKICLGTEGRVHGYRNIPAKPGSSGHMGQWDWGAHSQSETSIIRGQSGQSTAPRTKGLLSGPSQHLIVCSKEHFRGSLMGRKHLQDLPIEVFSGHRKCSTTSFMRCALCNSVVRCGTHSHNELQSDFVNMSRGYEKSTSPFSYNHTHCELFSWGVTCSVLHKVSLKHETGQPDTKASKQTTVGFVEALTLAGSLKNWTFFFKHNNAQTIWFFKSIYSKHNNKKCINTFTSFPLSSRNTCPLLFVLYPNCILIFNYPKYY